MGRNVIYYFSGTGNSLHAAKLIAETLGECCLISMGGPAVPSGVYDRVGFVFPCYAGGLPARVADFLRGLDLSENKNAYFFAIVTYGGLPGNALPQAGEMLKNKGFALHYGRAIHMFANYVALYGMATDPEQKAAQSDIALRAAAQEVADKARRDISGANPAVSLFYRVFLRSLPNKDRGFRVTDACVHCGKCEKVCPVRNIRLTEGVPVFHHRCEQCMACIQWCPTHAIEYKNKTQNRGRYHHPAIRFDEMLAPENER